MKNSVGTKKAKTSRKEAGPKAVVQAKNPGQQGGQIAVNAEYLQRIEVLSAENEIENCDFRAWLKNYAPDDIDDIVKALSQKYFALIDCKECANCCRVLELEFTRFLIHKSDLLKARVIIYAYNNHVWLLSPEPLVVNQPQSTRVEGASIVMKSSDFNLMDFLSSNRV